MITKKIFYYITDLTNTGEVADDILDHLDHEDTLEEAQELIRSDELENCVVYEITLTVTKVGD
jgi:hypothetical protein